MNFNDIPAKRTSLMVVAGTNPYPGSLPYAEVVKHTFTDELAQSVRVRRDEQAKGWGITEDGQFDRVRADGYVAAMGYRRITEWVPEWTGWHCVVEIP